jgi:uncharacterized membrane protein
MLRKKAARQFQKGNKNFRYRGHEVKRIEAFTDAVFAFAVTLLIVSLEVPHNFEELMATMKGFFAFGISFIFLMLIWYEQNVFFRRYALDDIFTILLNSALVFIVLFYVYPLKFLFTLLLGTSAAPVQIQQSQLPQLMYIYGAGYVSIYILFFLMYLHAANKQEALELTEQELFDTYTKMWAQLILVIIGLLSIITAALLPAGQAGKGGFMYFLIGPIYTIYYFMRYGKRKRLFELQKAEK